MVVVADEEHLPSAKGNVLSTEAFLGTGRDIR